MKDDFTINRMDVGLHSSHRIELLNKLGSVGVQTSEMQVKVAPLGAAKSFVLTITPSIINS
ncbi:MAG TPA: hypothetical protein ACQGQX_02755, partial [Xylella taiwanensis]